MKTSELLRREHSGLFLSTGLFEPVFEIDVSATTVPVDLVDTVPINLVEFYQSCTKVHSSDDFPQHFDLGNKPVASQNHECLYVAYGLEKGCHHDVVRKEIAGEVPCSTLEAIARLTIAQPAGNNGFLVNNGYENIFHVKGRMGENRLVSVSWFHWASRWCFSEQAVNYDYFWEPGTRFIFPKYVTTTVL